MLRIFQQQEGSSPNCELKALNFFDLICGQPFRIVRSNWRCIFSVAFLATGVEALLELIFVVLGYPGYNPFVMGYATHIQVSHYYATDRSTGENKIHFTTNLNNQVTEEIIVIITNTFIVYTTYCLAKGALVQLVAELYAAPAVVKDKGGLQQKQSTWSVIKGAFGSARNKWFPLIAICLFISALQVIWYCLVGFAGLPVYHSVAIQPYQVFLAIASFLGLFIILFTYFVIPSVVVESKGVIGSIRRSLQLLKGNVMSVFAVICVYTALYSLCQMGLASLLFPGYAPYHILFYLIHAIFLAINPVVATVVYFHIRARSEQLDPETLASELGVTSNHGYNSMDNAKAAELGMIGKDISIIKPLNPSAGLGMPLIKDQPADLQAEKAGNKAPDMGLSNHDWYDKGGSKPSPKPSLMDSDNKAQKTGSMSNRVNSNSNVNDVQPSEMGITSKHANIIKAGNTAQGMGLTSKPVEKAGTAAPISIKEEYKVPKPDATKRNLAYANAIKAAEMMLANNHGYSNKGKDKEQAKSAETGMPNNTSDANIATNPDIKEVDKNNAEGNPAETYFSNGNSHTKPDKEDDTADEKGAPTGDEEKPAETGLPNNQCNAIAPSEADDKSAPIDGDNEEDSAAEAELSSKLCDANLDDQVDDKAAPVDNNEGAGDLVPLFHEEPTYSMTKKKCATPVGDDNDNTSALGEYQPP